MCIDTQTTYTSSIHLFSFSTLISAVPRVLLDFILGEFQRSKLYPGRETTKGAARAEQIQGQVFGVRSRLRVVLGGCIPWGRRAQVQGLHHSLLAPCEVVEVTHSQHKGKALFVRGRPEAVQLQLGDCLCLKLALESLPGLQLHSPEPLLIPGTAGLNHLGSGYPAFLGGRALLQGWD